MSDITVPPLGDYIVTPTPEVGVMKDVQTFKASPEHQRALGFPGSLPDNWQELAIKRMGELLDTQRGLRVYLDSCVKCGACTDKCQFFLGTGDANNMPVARQDLLRNVYRRYFTAAGKMFPKLVGATDLTPEVLDSWYTYFYQCSECRRCSVFCPYGIDTAEISMAGREILDAVGIGQKYTNEILGKLHKIGNNLGLPEPALRNTLEGLEEDVKDATGHDVRFPVDVVGADVLLITPSADFFAEPHIDGLIGYAKVFHQAGISWTMSSYASEAANFAMFIGNQEQMRKVALRVRDAALALKVKRIVVGECGHAWRAAYSFWNTLVGPFDFLDPRYRQPAHICEVTEDLIARGALKLDPTANDDKVVTFHDSCNVARASRMGDRPGGQFTVPRSVIKSVCHHFVDMDENTIGDKTFCCGGGGGLLTDDLLDLRVKGAMPRLQALNMVVKEQKVTHMAAICAICKSQFTKVLPYYGFEREMVISVHQLVGDAIVLGAKD
ncbi:MAG TPA: (Fe-S)-binding protein [Acidiferrobacter sp.]|nr:(Fe-S)-binding protein [Acidiferrobacter sp.]